MLNESDKEQTKIEKLADQWCKNNGYPVPKSKWVYKGTWKKLKRKMIGDIVLLYGKTKLHDDDCKVIFKDKFKKEHEVEVSRLIQVFNNNIWQHKRSVK